MITCCCLTVWCLRCIDEAEKRSQPHGTALAPEEVAQCGTWSTGKSVPVLSRPRKPFSNLCRNIYSSWTGPSMTTKLLLVPTIQAFIERCRLYQTKTETPEQGQRLAGHLQYWETFLNALNASSPRPATSTPDESSAGSGHG